ALKERVPKSYNGIIDAYYENYIAGKTQAELIDAAHARLIPILISLRPLADDEVLVSLARVYAEQYEALWRTAGANVCYLYASGTGNHNYSNDLPAALIKREVELNERVVRTAVKRAPVSEAALEPIQDKLRKLLSIKGITPERLELLQATSVPSSRQAEYCAISISFFQSVGS